MEPARPLETPVVPVGVTVASPAAAQPQPVRNPMKKHPFLAAFLSFFPGLGNIYNGLYLRGVIFFTVVAALMAMGGDKARTTPRPSVSSSHSSGSSTSSIPSGRPSSSTTATLRTWVSRTCQSSRRRARADSSPGC